MRMLPVELRTRRLAIVCAEVEEPALEEPKRPVVSLAEPPAGLGHLGEDRL
jgi:hypothetical protein